MYEIDESEWPIVQARWIGVLSDEELSAFYERLDGWLARGQRFAVLLDSRRASGDLTAAQRTRVLAFIKANAERSGPLLVLAIVHEQAIHRALYALISHLFPLPYPSKTFSEPESARAWLQDKLTSVRPE